MGHARVEWDDKWIEANLSEHIMITELCRRYVAETGRNVNQHSFSTHIQRKYNHKSSFSWTEEEKQWVHDNFETMGSIKASKSFARIFGKERSVGAISAEARRQGLYVNEETVQANKNYSRRVPLGTIADDGDGYLKIKTGKGSSGWERYHRYVWEQRHGEIPPRHKIIFLNGDKRDYSEENLACIPTKYMALMNKYHLKSENPKITQTAIKWCELKTTLDNARG